MGIHDIMNDILSPSNRERDEDDDGDASFNNLLFGDSPIPISDIGIDDVSRHGTKTTANGFGVGDHVIHKNAEECIQGMIVEIRDISESPFPIRIEYYKLNEFKQRQQKFMWVLPRELIKVNSSASIKQQAMQYEEDEDALLYDYDDEDD